MSNKVARIATVEQLQFITPTTFLMSFIMDGPLDFEAGQFVSVIIPGAGPQGRDLRRAYSIACAPPSSRLLICVKRVEGGPGTSYLASRKPGDSVKIFVPFGDFVFKTTTDRRTCMIATGTGISPFLSMIQSAEFSSVSRPEALCLFGTTTREEILFEKEFRATSLLKWIGCLSREEASHYFHGRVTDYLRNHLSECVNEQTDYYLCGNGAMIAEVKQLLLDSGIPKSAIFQEKYY